MLPRLVNLKSHHVAVRGIAHRSNIGSSWVTFLLYLDPLPPSHALLQKEHINEGQETSLCSIEGRERQLWLRDVGLRPLLGSQHQQDVGVASEGQVQRPEARLLDEEQFRGCEWSPGRLDAALVS